MAAECRSSRFEGVTLLEQGAQVASQPDPESRWSSPDQLNASQEGGVATSSWKVEVLGHPDTLN